VVPYACRTRPANLFRAPWTKSETIVMVQWALDQYVDEWKRLAAMLLKPEPAAP